MKILVQRTGALGDVLEVTAITRRLRQEHHDALIDVETAYRNVFADNEDVSHPYRSQETYDRTIDLNGAFEKRLRKDHPIDAYSEETFGDRNTPHALHFQWKPLVRGIRDILPEKYAVFHPAISWPIRTLRREWWMDLVKAVDLPVVVTGTMQDHALHGVTDLRGALSLQGQAALIDGAACFVCSESGPMILAQTTKVPMVALLTMIPPEHVRHIRPEGFPGYIFMPATVPCVGCATEQPAETTYFDCRYGHRNCVSAFDIERVAGLIREKVA